jgi:hypothetical protein
MINPNAELLLHLFASQSLPLLQWTARKRQNSLYMLTVRQDITVDQHMNYMDNLDEVVAFVHEYDPPSVK